MAKKPVIERDLLDMLDGWESENGRLFLINDEHFAQTLRDRIESVAQEKENKRRGGKPAAGAAAAGGSVTRKASNSSLNVSNGSTGSTAAHSNANKRRNVPSESTTPAPSAKRMRVNSNDSSKGGLVNSITKSTHSHNSAIKPKKVVHKAAPPRYPYALSSVAESPAAGQDIFGKPEAAPAAPTKASAAMSKKSRRSSFKPEQRVASVSSAIDHQYAELEAIAAGEEEDW